MPWSGGSVEITLWCQFEIRHQPSKPLLQQNEQLHQKYGKEESVYDIVTIVNNFTVHALRFSILAKQGKGVGSLAKVPTFPNLHPPPPPPPPPSAISGSVLVTSRLVANFFSWDGGGGGGWGGAGGV